MNSRITPDEPFPADLARLRDQDVEVLNSKVHREIEHEYVTEGGIDPETAFRKDELADELDQRDAGPRLTLVAEQDAVEGTAVPEGTEGDDRAPTTESSAGLIDLPQKRFGSDTRGN